MKKYLICVLLLCLLSICDMVKAQNLTVQSAVGQNPTTLINNVLAGDGVLLSNAKFNNSAGNITYPQIGTFSYTGTAFPFHSGLILTTGDVSVAAGPNNSASASQAITNYYSDNSLSSLASSNVMSCAALEFDFVAYSDTFAFNYIFGSEEYPEYAPSQFNDVFAFFLTGPDPVTGATTTKNIAIIPNSITAANPNGLPVTINNVHAGSHSEYFTINYIGSGGLAQPNDGPVQYDGYTTRLTASALILSCYTYTMHLAIGNVGDNAYDSGVFLEAGSLYSPVMKVATVYSMPTYGDTLIKNYNEADAFFILPTQTVTNNYYTELYFGGDAVLNQDYEVTYNGVTLGGAGQNNTIVLNLDTANSTHIRVLSDAQFDEGQIKEAVIYFKTIFCDEYYEMDYPGSYRLDSLRFYLVDETYSAIAEYESQESFVWPNPAQNYCQVRLESEKIDKVFVFDLSGRCLQEVKGDGSNIILDLNGIPAGVYFLRINTEEGKTMKRKLVVTKNY